MGTTTVGQTVSTNSVHNSHSIPNVSIKYKCEMGTTTEGKTVNTTSVHNSHGVLHVSIKCEFETRRQMCEREAYINLAKEASGGDSIEVRS